METQTAQTQTVVEEQEQQQPVQPPAQQITPEVLPPSIPEAELLANIVDETTKRHLLDSIVERRRLVDSRNMGTYFANSGYFKDAQTLAQAFTKIEIGRCWGLNPAESMKSVVFVNQRPFCQNDAVAARLAEAGWSWKVQWMGAPPPKALGCRLYLKYRGEPYLDQEGTPVTVEFSLEMANSITVFENKTRISLSKKSGPWSDGWSWKMCYWKCIGLVRDFYAPNILSGARMQADSPELEDYEPMELVPVVKEPQRKQQPQQMSPDPVVSTRSEQATNAQQAPTTGGVAQGKKPEANPEPGKPEVMIITRDQANQFFKVCQANGMTDEQMVALVKAGGAERFDLMRADLYPDVFKMAQVTYGPGKEPKK